MKRLSLDDYETLVRGAQVLAENPLGPKVFRTWDGRIVKLFRRARFCSSALIWPPAARFVRASRRLAALGVASVAADGAFRIPEIGRHAVIYREIPGEVFRAAITRPERCDALITALASFLAELHAKGVYFRAVHFGNIVVTRSGELALIDISDARIKGGGSLGPSLRTRNFKHLFSCPEDAAALREFGLERFLALYHAAARPKIENQGQRPS